MKSIEIDCQALAAIGNGRRGACDDDPTRWQISQVRIQLRIHLYIWGKRKLQDTAEKVFSRRCIMALVDDLSAQVHDIGNRSARCSELVDAILEQASDQSISLDGITLCPR